MFHIFISVMAYVNAALFLLWLALSVIFDSPRPSRESKEVPANRRSGLDTHDASW